ncbi:MAG: hypothetical protein RIB60_01640 [Phycisphaerales bacterium]
MGDESKAPVKATLGRRWLIKMVVFIVLLLGLGVWGYVDATIVYPNRGRQFASWAKYQYLLAAKTANDNGVFGAFARNAVTINDPEAEFERLSEPETRQRYLTDASGEGRSALAASVDLTRHQWLKGLDRIGELTPEKTAIESPATELTDLTNTWSATQAPKELSFYDIPVQWIFTVVGFGGGAWLLIHVLRVASRKYTWDESTMTLTLPGGHAVTPDDLEEVDKSRWDKFIVALVIKSGHGTLGGRTVRIDTYQHADVEPWVLAMEEKAFPDQQESDAGSDAGTDAADAPADPAPSA